MDDDLHSIADSACDVGDDRITISFPAQGGFFGRGGSVTFRVANNTYRDAVLQERIMVIMDRSRYEQIPIQDRVLTYRDPPTEHMPGYNRVVTAMQELMVCIV